jgi:outer membrane protein
MTNPLRQSIRTGPAGAFSPGAFYGGYVRAILFLLICLLCTAPVAGASQLLVRLDNPPLEGTVVILLYDSPSAFADFRDPVVERQFIINGDDGFRVEDVTPGEYAMVLYYDENGNGRLDRNFIGIPTEPVGLANRYQPKGPPGYDRASFVLADNEVREMPVELWSPLGDWGSVGVGVGVIALSSPYRDYDGAVVQPIPAVTYIGERFQIFGPYAQVDIARIGGLHLAATANLRIGVYAEKDSPVLEGMGDRSTTLMGGLALRYNLPLGIELSAGYQHDVLGQIGGGAANIKLEETLPLGFLRITPGVGLKWLGKSLSNHDFGVPVGKARADRPAYRLGETFGIETGLGTFVEISRAWRLILNIGIEFLDGDIEASPIVGEGYVIQGFTALNYVF